MKGIKVFCSRSEEISKNNQIKLPYTVGQSTFMNAERVWGGGILIKLNETDEHSQYRLFCVITGYFCLVIGERHHRPLTFHIMSSKIASLFFRDFFWRDKTTSHPTKRLPWKRLWTPRPGVTMSSLMSSFSSSYRYPNGQLMNYLYWVTWPHVAVL